MIPALKEQQNVPDKLLIVTSLLVDVAAFPLRLPFPDQYNTGGYLIPSVSGSVYTYSNIDLAVAGLEAARLDLVVSDLPFFFDTHREMLSFHKFNLCLLLKDKHYIYSIAELRSLCATDYQLLTVCRHNAPLTFKWIKYDNNSKTGR